MGVEIIEAMVPLLIIIPSYLLVDNYKVYPIKQLHDNSWSYNRKYNRTPETKCKFKILVISKIKLAMTQHKDFID